MLSFPEKTYFNKRIPKQKFYDSIKLSPALHRQFVNEIDTIHWTNKLSRETLNIESGGKVEEIQIIQILLKQKSIAASILEVIDREIPYHLVFVLKYDSYGMIWINYKEENPGRKDKYTVDRGCKTDWVSFEELSLEIEGLNLDKVYENFMIQISQGRLKVDEDEDLKDAVMRVKDIDKLNTYITALENKVINEKQFNRQVELNRELRNAREELDRIK